MVWTSWGSGFEGSAKSPIEWKQHCRIHLLTAFLDGPQLLHNGSLVSPNVALQGVFQFHKGLYLQTDVVCNLSHMSHIIQERVTKPCLPHFWPLLKMQSISREKLRARWPIDDSIICYPQPLMESRILNFRHYVLWVKYHII